MTHDPGAVITAWFLLALIAGLTAIIVRDAIDKGF